MLIIRIKKYVLLFLLLGFVIAYSISPIYASLVPILSNHGLIFEDIENSLNVQSIELPFIKNEGQADARISFYRPTSKGMAFITTSGELLYSLIDESNLKKGALREQFKGGNANPVGLSKSAPSINYYLGNKPNRLPSNFPSYDSVKLGEVWPNIDISLHTNSSHVEKYFQIQPGGDISSIQVQISYAKSLEIHKEGNLVVHSEIGPIIFSEPKAYQIINGKKIFVSTSYQIDDLTYGFRVDKYDPNITLYIDPLMIIGKQSE